VIYRVWKTGTDARNPGLDAEFFMANTSHHFLKTFETP
jgi:hypothetical protein